MEGRPKSALEAMPSELAIREYMGWLLRELRIVRRMLKLSGDIRRKKELESKPRPAPVPDGSAG